MPSSVPNLTAEQIEKLTKNLIGRPGAFQTSFMGMKVYIDPSLDNVPNFKLSPELEAILSTHNQKFLNDFNEWSKQFFGTKAEVIMCDMPSLNIFGSGEDQKVLFVGPQTHRKMLAQLPSAPSMSVGLPF
jgi:hypothetical protein